MTELFFLRHGLRADQAPPGEEPLASPYKVWDPLVTVSAAAVAETVASDIVDLGSFAGDRKNVYVHFSPYLRCCQTADLLVSAMRRKLEQLHPNLKCRFLLLGDFALSEWIHDKMKHKPPFVDSTEAYQMYTPNIQQMENKRLLLNFRPTTQLGQWNEPDLSFKDYLERCKAYFQKLLATYDKPLHENDVIVVVSHGYAINNFMSYFINHPIFEEIAEFSLNYARKIDDKWTLVRDGLGILERDSTVESVLNLELDIVYYKTNFIKKDEYDEQKQFPAMGFGGLRGNYSTLPRPSFKVMLLNPTRPGPTPLCPAAKNWNPQDANKYKVKSEFRQKLMNDGSFKKAFDITKAPTHPISPNVSPSSAPSRTNSTVNLHKLTSNEEIYHPLKLKYSLASDIPVQFLNSKVNSHVSLAQFSGTRSYDSSSLDLTRNRFSGVNMLQSHGLNSPKSDQESANINEVIRSLARVRSLQRKRTPTPKFGIISENEHAESIVDTGPEHDASDEEKKFSLVFRNEKPASLAQVQPARRRRSSSIKFVPTILPITASNKTSIFYNLASGSSSGDESLEDEQPSQKYTWFGQNASYD